MVSRIGVENKAGFWSHYVRKPMRVPFSYSPKRRAKSGCTDGCSMNSAKLYRRSRTAALVVAARFRDRLAGFLVSRPPNCLLLIAPCHSIHTFGMKEDLDVAFFDRSGTILMAREHVGPARIVRCPGAYGVLERHSRDGRWYCEGETLIVT